MKKTIVKTALITLACLLVASAVFYAVVCKTNPGGVSDFYHNAGNEKLALHFMQKEFERLPTNKNMQLVTERAILAEDATVVKRYAAEVLKKIKSGKIEATTSYAYYIASAYCYYLYLEGSKQFAIDCASGYSMGYGNLNPLQKLIVTGIENEDDQFLGDVLVALANFNKNNYNLLVQEARDRLSTDITNLTAYLNR